MDIPNEDEDMETTNLDSHVNAFPHPLDQDLEYSLIVSREHYFRVISNLIREKDNWWEKLENSEIREKWTRDAEKIHRREIVTNKEDIEFIFRELRECYRPFGSAKIQPAIDCVWKSDTLIPEELREKLLKGVSILENVPESDKDWHPGSDKQVLDLVHPSLYPLVYGRSHDIKSSKPIHPSEPPDEWMVYESDEDFPFSLKFQWLPSDFQIAEDGSTVIKSYINNLSPGKHRDLYPVIGDIFSHFVPMFNNVLSELRQGRDRLRRVKRPNEQDSPEEIPYKSDSDQESEDSCGEDGLKEAIDSEDEIDVNYKYRREPKRKWDMGDLSGDRFSPPELTEKLNGKTVKVIVKLANIILTPENPKYDGGSWHVEGMLNERIVATGIYYYDQENITESQLRFRHLIEELGDDDIPPGGYFASNVLNVDWMGSSVQQIGYVVTKKNRSIVFPNIFQHCVSGFKLQDTSKPGFRKILVFFLCDPYASDQIISTSSVAPQTEEFLQEQISAMRECHRLGNLPEDVFQMVLKEIPPPISLKEAKAYREALMDERRVFTTISPNIQGVSYSVSTDRVLSTFNPIGAPGDGLLENIPQNDYTSIW